MIDYLATDDITDIHAIPVSTWVGMSGIRDTDGLGTSVCQPQCGSSTDYIEQADTILEGILTCSPFIDNNKRAA